jgi:hypothetical protein
VGTDRDKLRKPGTGGKDRGLGGAQGQGMPKLNKQDGGEGHARPGNPAVRTERLPQTAEQELPAADMRRTDRAGEEGTVLRHTLQAALRHVDSMP